VLLGRRVGEFEDLGPRSPSLRRRHDDVAAGAGQYHRIAALVVGAAPVDGFPVGAEHGDHGVPDRTPVIAEHDAPHDLVAEQQAVDEQLFGLDQGLSRCSRTAMVRPSRASS
jgi:hypothetical protein